MTGEVGYVFNTKHEALLTNKTVRQWVEQERKIVILIAPTML